MKYIAYIWGYNKPTAALLSRSEESFADFKSRVADVYPSFEDWHVQYSEFKEIY